MIRFGAILCLLGVLAAPEGTPKPAVGPLRPSDPAAASAVRFSHVDVFIDPGIGQRLAAYQCEITATAGDVALVGIEGGDHAAFKVPPYYDPRALGKGRVILGGLNTGTDLPVGRTRVARLMIRTTGAARPSYQARVQAAASPDGRRIAATVSLSEGAF